MILLLMRHGIAEELADAGDVDDAGRELTTGGRKKLREVAKYLRRAEMIPTLYLSSPRKRAIQTAKEVMKTCDGDERIVELDSLDIGAVWRDFVNDVHLLAKKKKTDASIVLASGHMPSCGQFVTEALTGLPMGFEFKKGAVVALEWDGEIAESGARLLFYMTAKFARRN
ncbi:phosphohistidine phosphatase SixA [soil metagenome]